MLSCALVVVTAVSAAADPAWNEPTPKPDGWVHDFDYQSSIQTYLRQQYDSARLEGATAYVYVFRDESRHCRGTRRVMVSRKVAPVLRDVRITMLSYDRLKWLLKRMPGATFDPGEWVPILAKITMDGRLVEVFLPDLYLYHPRDVKDPKYQMLSMQKPITEAEFADVLKDYFDANAER